MVFVLNEEPVPTIQKEGTLERLRIEFDGYLEEMTKLQSMEPSEVFLKLSGWTARATEVRIQLARTQTSRNERMKTKEIEPFLEEAERQFRFFSRYLSTQIQEMTLSGKTT